VPALTAICDELTERVSQLTALLESKEAERHDVDEEVQRLREANVDLQSTILSREDKFEELNLELSTARRYLSAMSATSTKLEGRVAQLEATLEAKAVEEKLRVGELNGLNHERVSLKEQLGSSEAEVKKLLKDLHRAHERASKLAVNRRQLQSIADAAAQQKIAELEGVYLKILRRLKSRVDDDDDRSELTMGKLDLTLGDPHLDSGISDAEKIRHVSFGSCRLLFREILPNWSARVPSSFWDSVNLIDFLHDSAKEQVFKYLNRLQEEYGMIGLFHPHNSGMTKFLMRYACLVECGKDFSELVVKMCFSFRGDGLDSSSFEEYHRKIYPKVERTLSDFEFFHRFRMTEPSYGKRIGDYMRDYCDNRRIQDFGEWALTFRAAKEGPVLVDLSSKAKVLACDLLRSLGPVGPLLVDNIPNGLHFFNHSLRLHDVYDDKPGLISALRSVNTRLAKVAFCRELESGRRDLQTSVIDPEWENFL
jgi:hypothetical protein